MMTIVLIKMLRVNVKGAKMAGRLIIKIILVMPQKLSTLAGTAH